MEYLLDYIAFVLPASSGASKLEIQPTVANMHTVLRATFLVSIFLQKMYFHTTDIVCEDGSILQTGFLECGSFYLFIMGTILSQVCSALGPQYCY